MSLCEWMLKGGPSARERLILVTMYEMETEGLIAQKIPRSRGLLTRHDVTRPIAIIFGVATPILLLGVAQYVLFFQRSKGRD